MRGFRGATQPVEIEFNTTKPIVMIFGENGTGKSTIVDAIDFICNESYGSLQDRSSVKHKAHVCALNSKPKDLAVDMTFGGQLWTSNLGTSGPQTTGPSPRPQAEILRRHRILAVVDEQPGKRYTALQSFLAPAKIEKAEKALRASHKNIDERFDEATLVKEQADEALEKLWEAEGKPGLTYLDWAQQQLQQTTTDLQDVIKQADDLLSVLDSAKSARERMQEAEQQHTINISKATNALATLAQAEANAQNRDSQKALIDLLQKAQIYLREQLQLNSCPLCLKPHELSQLQKQIGIRLQEMNTLVELKRVTDEAQSQTGKSAAVLEEGHAKFIKAVDKLLANMRQSYLPDVESLKIGLPVLLNGGEVVERDIGESVLILEAVEAARAAFKSNRDAASKKSGRLLAIKNHLEIIKEKTAEAIRLERQKTRLAKMLEIVEKCRKDYINDFLDEISNTVEDFYRKLHPDEPIGNFRFFLKANVMGSLEFTGTFAGASDVPPQAYYSESHLDTLGICVFLAMVKHTRDKDCIVVLDDVLTSVDSSHLHRFIEMVQEVAADFGQLILTTHYRHWYDRFKRRGGGNLQFIELSSWSLNDGLRPAEAKFEIDSLKQMLMQSPFPRQELTGKAGVFLEQILDALALHYGLRLPRMDTPRYTLAQLLDAATKPSKSVYTESRSEGVTDTYKQIKLEPLIKALYPYRDIRNEVGAHYNQAGAEWSNEDVRRFAELTIQTGEMLLCPHCGEIPARNKNGSWWQCSCKTHEYRLYPYTIP